MVEADVTGFLRELHRRGVNGKAAVVYRISGADSTAYDSIAQEVGRRYGLKPTDFMVDEEADNLMLSLPLGSDVPMHQPLKNNGHDKVPDLFLDQASVEVGTYEAVVGRFEGLMLGIKIIDRKFLPVDQDTAERLVDRNPSKADAIEKGIIVRRPATDPVSKSELLGIGRQFGLESAEA